jgi:dipeptidyl aminopeptidase/acylaminoacyl peptidase
VHGSLDDVVPPDLSASYCNAAAERGDPVEMVEVPGAGHFDLIDPRSRAWPAVLGAVRGLFD